MAQNKADAQARRRMRGFETAAQLLAQRVRVAGESRGFAVARLLTHWDEVVGPEIAAHARPVKVRGADFSAFGPRDCLGRSSGFFRVMR